MSDQQHRFEKDGGGAVVLDICGQIAKHYCCCCETHAPVRTDTARHVVKVMSNVGSLFASQCTKTECCRSSQNTYRLKSNSEESDDHDVDVGDDDDAAEVGARPENERSATWKGGGGGGARVGD